MCTATWIRAGEGYELLFNRDELKSRAEAAPPSLGGTGGLRWVAPADPDGGGTWIATNEVGLTIGLLNGRRGSDDASRAWTSRGLLVPALVGARDPAGVEERLARADLQAHRAFRLLVIAPGTPALVADWDRVRLSVDRDAEARVPLVSSSFDEHAVGEARRAEFARLVPGPVSLERLLAFHRSTGGGPSAFTVSMERPDASTRSFTHVSVGEREIVFRYHAGRPDLPAPESVVRLARSPRATGSALRGAGS